VESYIWCYVVEWFSKGFVEDSIDKVCTMAGSYYESVAFYKSFINTRHLNSNMVEIKWIAPKEREVALNCDGAVTADVPLFTDFLQILEDVQL